MTETEFPAGLPVGNPTKSYWHREPSKTLLGHRTTKDLPHAADVVIIGSGITGAFAAHFLKEKDPSLNVVMLEAREACWGATGRNGGHCQPAMYAAAPHIAAFELRNYSYLKTLVEAYSIPCDWHSTTGVHAYYSDLIFSNAEKVVKKLQQTHPDLAANVAIVTKGEGGSPAWLLESERKELTLKGLRIEGASGAIVQWHAASLWPYKLVAFVLERLLAAGGFNLQTTTPATGLQRIEAPPGLTGDGAFSKESWVVHTPRGNIAARHVLLATNGYTSHLLPQFSDLIVPTKGQVSSLKPPPPSSSSEDQHLPPLDIGHTYYFANKDSQDDYLVQRPPLGAELVFGGGRVHAEGRGVGVWDDSNIDEPVAWYLKGELSSMLDLTTRSDPSDEKPPATVAAKKQDLEATYEWTGIMGYSRDGHPWVGPVPESSGGGGGGLWMCAAYTGHGMPNATLSAKAVVDMIIPGRVEGDELADEVDLPPEYMLTAERIKRVRARRTVRDADTAGFYGFDLGDRLL